MKVTIKCSASRKDDQTGKWESVSLPSQYALAERQLAAGGDPLPYDVAFKPTQPGTYRVQLLANGDGGVIPSAREYGPVIAEVEVFPSIRPVDPAFQDITLDGYARYSGSVTIGATFDGVLQGEAVLESEDYEFVFAHFDNYRQLRPARPIPGDVSSARKIEWTGMALPRFEPISYSLLVRKRTAVPKQDWSQCRLKAKGICTCLK